MGEEAQATISFRAMTEADIPALVGIEAQSFMMLGMKICCVMK